jgi:peptidyl-tRNA hydrolase
MWFNVENSFLNYPVAVFEELFDAPAFCLLPLKHTLQAGFLAKNGKSYPMKTEIIIACTNRDPEEIAEMGETYRALLERFVLRQEVVWQKYDVPSYSNLLKKHKSIDRIPEELRTVFATTCANCFDSGNFISPRTAMKAVDVICGAATSANRQLAVIEDLHALSDVAGFGKATQKLKDSFELIIRQSKAENEMQIKTKEFDELIKQVESGTVHKVIEYCILAKKFLNLHDMFSAISVPDSMYDKKMSYAHACADKSNACMTQALNQTKV